MGHLNSTPRLLSPIPKPQNHALPRFVVFGYYSSKPNAPRIFVMLQDVLNNSDHQAVLQLANIVAGRYVFTLTVSDAEGLTNSDTASVIVKPGK